MQIFHLFSERRKWPALLLGSLGMLAFTLTTASAEIISPDTILGVRTRVVSEDDPLGIRVGSFKFQPVLELRSVYDDNVFRVSKNAKADLITNIRPALTLQSDWYRHALYFAAVGDFGSYKDSTSEDYKDFALTASGQYDLMRETYFTGGTSYSRRHLGNNTNAGTTSDDSEQGNYETFSQVVGFTRALSYIKLKIFGRNTHAEISDKENEMFLGSDDFVERNSQSLSTTISYDYMKDNGFFISNTTDTTDYELPGNFSGTSDGMNWRLGMNFNTGGLWSGSFFGGYLHRKYDDGTDNTSEPYFGGTLRYNFSALTQISLTLDKTFTETTSEEAAGIVKTTRRLELRQSVTPFVTARAAVGYDDNDYVGGTSNNRQAEFFYTEVSGDYNVSDNVAVRLGYDYRERTSNQENDDYKNNRVLLSLIYNP